MFPPTIKATPSSPRALLNPIIITVMSSGVASFKSNCLACFSVVPIEIANSHIVPFNFLKMSCEMEIINGVMSMDSPIIIPYGVYSRLIVPSGPVSLSMKYITSPRITVGIPTSALSIDIRWFFPLKSFNARFTDSGIDHVDASIVAVDDTSSERTAISAISEDRLVIHFTKTDNWPRLYID